MRALSPQKDEAMSIPPPSLNPQAGPYTILIVDDDPDMRLLCATTLALAGFNILQAPGSTEAMEICVTFKEEIHLALVDVLLPPADPQWMTERTSWPRVHGHKLILQLLAKRKGLRAVMMSAHSKGRLMNNGLNLVGLKEVSFLSKPFSPQELLRAIRHQCESHPPSGIR